MNEEYVEKIVEAVRKTVPAASGVEITKDTAFADIPNMDSMTIVDFQMNLAGLMGDKAHAASPVPEMTVGEYSDLLASL